MLKFINVFCRDLQGKQEHPLFLNMAHFVKIEVAGTPEDLVTHERYFYPKTTHSHAA